MYVAKRQIAVRASQSGHDPIDGFFCLALAPAPPEEAGTLLELLNSSSRVIPLIRAEDGAVILLTRLNIDWVMAGERVEASLIYPARGETLREEPVVLHFMNGTTMDGLILMDAAAMGSRASDFLNDSGDFYPVRTRLGTLFVNKSRVRETRLSTISPRWASQKESPVTPEP